MGRAPGANSSPLSSYLFYCCFQCKLLSCPDCLCDGCNQRHGAIKGEVGVQLTSGSSSEQCGQKSANRRALSTCYCVELIELFFWRDAAATPHVCHLYFLQPDHRSLVPLPLIKALLLPRLFVQP